MFYIRVIRKGMSQQWPPSGLVGNRLGRRYKFQNCSSSFTSGNECNGETAKRLFIMVRVVALLRAAGIFCRSLEVP